MIEKISENEYIETTISLLFNGDENKSIVYYKNGKIHRDNEPAILKYNGDKLIEKQYYKNGIVHRDNGPAAIYYYDNGKLSHETYFINGIQPSNGLLQKSYFKKDERINGVIYIENGIWYNKQYYYNNKIKVEIVDYGDKQIEIGFYDTGEVKRIHFSKGRLKLSHSENGKPATITYHKNGNVRYE